MERKSPGTNTTYISLLEYAKLSNRNESRSCRIYLAWCNNNNGPIYLLSYGSECGNNKKKTTSNVPSIRSTLTFSQLYNI